MASENIVRWFIEVGWEMMDTYRSIVVWLNEPVTNGIIADIFGTLRRYEFMFGAALPALLGFVMIKFLIDAVA